MYIQNRRESSKFKVCSPLQHLNGLISWKPAIAYFAYTKRCVQIKNKPRLKKFHKIFLPFFMLFIIGACNGQDLIKNSLQDDFSPQEINSLIKIVEFFDDLVVNQTGQNSIDSAYFFYMKNLYFYDSEEDFLNKLFNPKSKIDSFISQLSLKPIFNSLWIYEYGRDYQTKDTVNRILAPNYDGKYYLLYNKIAEQDSIFHEYSTYVQMAGNITPGQFWGFQQLYDKLNFKNELIRLGIAVHYIMIISETELLE